MIQGHGDDAYRFGRPIRANFSSNVYGHVDLEPLKEHLRKRLDVIGNYPEPEPYRLEAALAAGHGIPAGAVCVTSGATEAIYLIAHAFQGSRSAILQPTFSEYADACMIYGHTIVPLSGLWGSAKAPSGASEGRVGSTPVTKHLEATLPAAMLPATDGLWGSAQAPSGASEGRVGSDVLIAGRSGGVWGSAPVIIWFCNPNNPDGRVIGKEEILAAVADNPETIFIIDQSYGFFTREALLSPAEAAACPNVLQLHSMTKRYAMPGLRLGYITGQEALLARIRAVRMPWSVNALAIEAGLYLREHPGTAPVDLDALLAEACRLRERLCAIPGVSVAPTRTHFMLCRLEEGSARDLKEWLAQEHGILIRDASNFEGLDGGCFRVAAQTPAENDMLVEAVRSWQEGRR